jgi:hypothetical protein
MDIVFAAVSILALVGLIVVTRQLRTEIKNRRFLRDEFNEFKRAYEQRFYMLNFPVPQQWEDWTHRQIASTDTVRSMVDARMLPHDALLKELGYAWLTTDKSLPKLVKTGKK